MLKPALLATALAVGLSSFAAAQATSTPGAPPPPAAAAAAMPGPGGDARPMPGDMPPPPPPGGGPRPGDHRGPPPPPPPMGKGVEIRLGRDAGIRINCGDETMQACIAAAKPLTDRIADLKLPAAPQAPVTGDDLPAPAAN